MSLLHRHPFPKVFPFSSQSAALSEPINSLTTERLGTKALEELAAGRGLDR